MGHARIYLAPILRPCSALAFVVSHNPYEDPVGVLLMIDFYAIRSEEYNYLLRLFEELESSQNLSHLPNFAFSMALAMYHLGKKNPAMARKADSMLEESLLMFPCMLIPLLTLVKFKLPKDIAWFTYWRQTALDTLKYPAVKELMGLYFERSFSLWKPPDVTEWLIKKARSAMEYVRNGDPRIAEFAKTRAVRYKTNTRKARRHIYICNIFGALLHLPNEVDKVSGKCYDPLPPLDAVESYM